VKKGIKFWTKRWLVEGNNRCRNVLQGLKSIVQSVTDIQVRHYARETNNRDIVLLYFCSYH